MIEVKNIRKSFSKKTVIRDLSFTAKKGEITCLIGINGSGKTTTLNAIMGLTPIDSGEILINGKGRTKETYEEIAYIPDTITMLSRMTIKDAFSFMEDFYQSWNQERAYEILSFFKLQDNEKISNLSKGNKMKVNLLLGLALDVDFLLMDEPFSGIDLFSREQIIEVFTSHLIEDRGVLMTTHEINDIEHLIDQAIIINNGVTITSFYPEEKREKKGQSIIDVMKEVMKG